MILVTGFGPYQEGINASGEVVHSLAEDLPETLTPFKDEIVFEVITVDDTSRDTEHESLEIQLECLLNKYKPGLCLHTGQAPPYNKVTIERIATNTFMREVIDPYRPVAYWSNMPGTESLKEALEEEDVPSEYSFYCGQHLCNHILYSSLYFSEKNTLAHKSGFIHIPLLPEQVRNTQVNSSNMPLSISRKALTLCIKHALDAHRAS